MSNKEQQLNETYLETFTENSAVEAFIYLTNKNRGKHTTENAIRKAYRDGKLGTMLKKFDPIAFNVDN